MHLGSTASRHHALEVASLRLNCTTLCKERLDAFLEEIASLTSGPPDALQQVRPVALP